MSSDPYAPIRAVACSIQRGIRPLGTGVLIGPSLVATCRHVISGLEPEAIQAVFLAGPNGELGVQAKILSVSSTELSNDALDLALLHLSRPVSLDLTPIPLGWPAFERPFLCWGFPELRDQEDEVPESISAGLGRHGTVLSPVGTTQEPRLQLHSKLQIHPGLSGSPVVQTEPLRVVGLISTSLEPRDEGLAVPLSALAGAFPTLPSFELLNPAPPSAHDVPRRIVALGQTRAPSRTFVGRLDDLRALEAKLTTSGKVAVQAAITGLAGIGKTELALHYAHYHADPILFPGGVIWLDASTDLTGQWARLAPLLGLEAGALDPRDVEPAVLGELAGRPRLLLVLDNAESWQALQGHLPLGGTAHAYLVTTRERDFAWAQFQHLPLGILDDESARELLQAVMGARAAAHPEEVERLVAAFGGHALALEIAGAYLARHPRVRAEEMAKRLTEVAGRRDLDGIQYGKSFAAMLEELLARLAQDDPAAAGLFPLLGLFGDAPGSVGLLEAVWQAVRGESFEEGFATLVALHLVDRVGTEGWTTHRLIRTEALERLGREGEAEERGRKALASATLQGLQALDDFDFAGYAGLEPHLQVAAAWKPGSREVADLLQRARQYPWRLGEPALALAWNRKALEIHEADLGSESTAVATDRSNLALILKDLGDLEGARREVEEALRIDRKALGDDYPSVAIDRSNLAAILKDLGDLEGARREVEEALRIDRQALGDDHPNVATARSNLATILRDLGDLEGARREIEEARRIDRKALGDDHPNVAIRRSNLATILRDLGDLEGARREVEEALRIGRKALGDDHPDVAIDRSNLATILENLGDLEGARREVEEALRINRKALGDDHALVGTHRSNLATILQDLGDLEGARREVEEALRIDRKALGDDHPNVAIDRSILATILQDLGDLEGARREVEEALRIDRKALGDDHNYVGTDRSILAGVLRSMGDLEGAKREAREAVRIALLQPAGSKAREKILENWQSWLASQPTSDT